MKTNKILRLFVSLGASLLLGVSVFGQEPVHEAQGMTILADGGTVTIGR